jgi:hypothetical protein
MNNSPYISTVIRCAGPNCSKVKGDTNHWFMAFVNSGSVTIYTWSYELFDDIDCRPLCGESCASKLVSKFMSDVKAKLDPVPAPTPLAPKEGPTE